MNQKELEQLVNDLAMAEAAAAKRLADEEKASRERLNALDQRLRRQSENAVAALEQEMAEMRDEQVRTAEKTIETMQRKARAMIKAMSKRHEASQAKLIDWAVGRIAGR